MDEKQKDRIQKEINRIDAFTELDDDMVICVGKFLKWLSVQNIPMNSGELLVDMDHWNDDKRSVLSRWARELVRGVA